MNDYIICKKCVITNSFPGIKFNDKGICNLCYNSSNKISPLAHSNKLRSKMEASINKVVGKGVDYDCIVAFSGGKDSSYTLGMLVKKYNLRW